MELLNEISDLEETRREFEAYINEFYWGGQHVKAALVATPEVEENGP